MTTIAYRAGVLAGDGRVTNGETVMGDKNKKVFKFRDGRLFAAAGCAEECELLRNAAMKNEPVPELEDIAAILITTDGAIWNYEGKAWVKDEETYTAIGSGADYALAAMDFGANAVQAVKGACKRHTHSGGRITSVKLRKTKSEE